MLQIQTEFEKKSLAFLGVSGQKLDAWVRNGNWPNHDRQFYNWGIVEQRCRTFNWDICRHPFNTSPGAADLVSIFEVAVAKMA